MQDKSHYTRYNYKKLYELAVEMFIRYGFSREDSEKVADVILTSDRFGVESHGVNRLTLYPFGIDIGRIKVDAKPEVVEDRLSMAVIDAHDGMGQLIGHFAMELAIEKAKKSGVGIVSARNSNHFGIAGYYANMACKEGLIGFSCTNSEAIMVPTFGRKAMIGSNPIACAMPAEPYNFFFDASTTVVTRGKLEMYNKAEKPLPEGWALDKDGRPTTDPAAGRAGSLVPIGGAKGSGLAIMVDVLCGILSGGPYGPHLHDLYVMDEPQGVSHFLGAIDIAHFIEPAAFKSALSAMSREIKALKKADGVEEIFLPGERSGRKAEENAANGIEVPQPVYEELLELGKPYGLSL